jgi:hypothetical protein
MSQGLFSLVIFMIIIHMLVLKEGDMSENQRDTDHSKSSNLLKNN